MKTEKIYDIKISNDELLNKINHHIDNNIPNEIEITKCNLVFY